MPAKFFPEGHSIFLLHDICPLQDFLRNFKSVAVLHRAYEELFEFLVKRIRRYGGARPCKDLKTIILDSLFISNKLFNGFESQHINK